MDEYRLRRIAGLLTKALSAGLARRIVRDPRVHTLITVRSIRVSSDLRQAVVGVSGYMSRTALRKSVVGLNSAAGFLQSYLSKQVRLRVVPHLHFIADASLKKGFDTIQKITQGGAETPEIRAAGAYPA